MTNGTKSGAKSRLVALALIVVLFVPALANSDGLSLLSLSARARLSNETTLGGQQPEEFDEYTLAAHLGLPWQREIEWGWVVDTRLMASAGLMQGAGENGLIVSLIPQLGFRPVKWPLLLDLGAGGALLSRYKSGDQDFGGPFQFALTTGASFRFYKQLGIGYRFMHYSDGGMYGDDTVGSDFHMIELFYYY